MQGIYERGRMTCLSAWVTTVMIATTGSALQVRVCCLRKGCRCQGS